MENRRRAFLPAFVERLEPRMQVEVRCQLFGFLDQNIWAGPLHRLVTWLNGSKPVHSATEHDDDEIALGKASRTRVEQRRANERQRSASGDEFASVQGHTFNIHSLERR